MNLGSLEAHTQQPETNNMDALLSTIYLLICIAMLGFGYALGKSASSHDCSDFGAFSNGTAYYTCASSAPRYQK